MPSAHAQTDPLIGRLVDGRYRVRGRVARGGMATVYVATDLRLERRIALKVMHSHLSDDSVFQSRFIQEARSAAQLSDPHVVAVYDQGQDGDLAYLVMEYLPGITLRDLLKERGRLTVVQTITVMDSVLAGLAAAHRAGLIHRDVKPENVLLAEDGRIKVSDFGLARASTANTASGAQLLGTIAYLAPELVTRGTADARSDIYALGIMLYEMLTGEQPYKGEQPMQIAYQHATESVPRPSIKNPGVPEQLDELVLWATEREPDERPDDASVMLDRLREIERQLGVKPLPTRHEPAERFDDLEELPDDTGGHTKILPQEDAATRVLTGSLHTEERAEPDDFSTTLRRRSRRRRTRGAWALIVTLLLAGAAGATGWWWGSGPGSQETVPQLEGVASFSDAQAALAEHDLEGVEQQQSSLDVAAGYVIDSDPDAGARLDKGSTVTVITSSGPAPVDLGEMSGQTEDDVRGQLGDAHITVADDNQQLFTDSDAGTVLAVAITPAAGGDPIDCTSGCSVHEGDAAQLTVSLGALPNVVGMTLDDATSTLDAAGLTIEEASQEYSSTVPEGQIISYLERDGGGSWRPGDTVKVVTSLGPQLFDVPDVTGWTIRDAVAELQEAGFAVNANIDDTELPLGGGYWDIYVVQSYTPTDPQPAGATISLTPVLSLLSSG
ncbi:MAG: Stk1 family PASTA domain-containing Ser/Thr kinase [Microbacterium sp.]